MGGFSRLRLTAQSCLSVVQGLGGSSLVAALLLPHTTQDSLRVCSHFSVVERSRSDFHFFRCSCRFLRCTASVFPLLSALLGLYAREVALQGHSCFTGRGFTPATFYQLRHLFEAPYAGEEKQVEGFTTTPKRSAE